MYKILCAVLAFIISFLSSVGLPVRKDETGNSDVLFTAKNITVNGSAVINAVFDKESDVNTVEITFDSSSEAQVVIKNGGNTVYSSTSFDAYRFCAFKTLKTDKLEITVNGYAKIKSISVSRKTADCAGFRVTSYFVSQYINTPGSVNPDVFDVVTDAILFGCVTFDRSGELVVDKALLEPSLANLRQAVGERNVNIYINVLGPDADSGIPDWYDQMDNKAAKHSEAFKSGKLESSITALLDEYGFDGIFFDYEYPIKNKYWNDFSRFIVKLDKLTDKKIGLAVASWDIGLSKAAVDCVDMLEVMQYDLFDEQGNHSSFTQAVVGYEDCRDYFIPLEKADIGLPFYGRPVNRGALWYNYRDYVDLLGKSVDYADTAEGGFYFNSWQTVYDKTAYSISRGLGGMMVWHYSCDVYDVNSEYSLFGAMRDCIADRAV